MKVRILLWWAMENSFNFNYVYFLRKYPFSLFKLQKQYRIYAAYISRTHAHTERHTLDCLQGMDVHDCASVSKTRALVPGNVITVEPGVYINKHDSRWRYCTYCYIYTLFLFKGRVHVFFFIRELEVPPLGESNLMGPKKSVEVKFFTVTFFGCVIDNVGCTFLPFNLISPPYTTSYHFP